MLVEFGSTAMTIVRRTDRKGLWHTWGILNGADALNAEGRGTTARIQATIPHASKQLAAGLKRRCPICRTFCSCSPSAFRGLVPAARRVAGRLRTHPGGRNPAVYMSHPHCYWPPCIRFRRRFRCT
jgi:hypothetical protein